MIYYEYRGKNGSQEAYNKCMDENNQGFQFAILMFLLFGYGSFVLMLVFLLILCCIFTRHRRANRQAQSQSSRVLNTISRMKFSEDLFGEVNEDNSCVICMVAYDKKDTVTKLKCNDKHFFHT